MLHWISMSVHNKADSMVPTRGATGRPNGKHTLVVVILTVVSWYIILRNASEEPYVHLRWPDALEQVMLGGVVSLAWVYYFYMLVRDITKYRLSLLWLVVLPWIVVTFYFVQFAANGYIEDIKRYGNDEHFKMSRKRRSV
jgi:hypothetical protein